MQEAKNMQEKFIIDTEEILQLMWVYTYKFDADGYLSSYKARLVARGDLYHSTEETYAATLAAQVFRATIAISTFFSYKIRQYDIVAAYTNADLHQPVLAHLPDGFEVKNCFLLIKKALYGLPGSALLWQNHLQDTFLNLGLSPVPGVNCLFKDAHLIILVYVDNIMVACHERNSIRADDFESKLIKKYQTKPLGQIDHFLGIRVVRDEFRQKIWLVQDAYIDTIANKFNIDTEKMNIPSTPLPTKPLYRNPGQATAREIN